MEHQNKQIDPSSRKYDFKDIKMDERFVQINKEVIATVVLFFIHSIIIIVNLYTGAGDPANYTYIMGFPKWFFIQLCEFVVYIICAFLLISYFYKDMDVTPRGKLIPRKKK